MYFNRFDVVEAYALLAHDYGLYGLFDRITHDMRATFPILRYDALSENGKAIYLYNMPRAERTSKTDRKLARRMEVL